MSPVVEPRVSQMNFKLMIGGINKASALPDLPRSFFGWIPTLWFITDEKVLATAGLDAYVFLAFFKMAIRFTGYATILAYTILLPIQYYYDGSKTKFGFPSWVLGDGEVEIYDEKKPAKEHRLDGPYLWAYLGFIYIFTALAVFLLIDATREVMSVRQRYLGGQVTITDRTIRLSGVPSELRSEAALKEYVEDLGIGKVEAVTICRDWKELDALMEQRTHVLRRLEEAYTSYYGRCRKQRRRNTLLAVEPEAHDEEAAPLLNGNGNLKDGMVRRPMRTLRYGYLKLKTKKIDAIDHYEARLSILDEQIIAARKKEYKPVPIAFVTMATTAAAQVAIQAVLDPRFATLLAYQAPSPASIVWRNTYMSRLSRVSRSWSISAFVTILSVVWLVPVTGLAALLNIEDIRKISPPLADVLEGNEIIKSLVQGFLPTLALTLLNVAVPYFYDWLSNYQGMISQAEVELSVISKNFFFTFFNLFCAFTILGTALTFEKLWDELKGSLSDTTRIAYALAGSLNGLAAFYVNLIILQGIGMFPFRLLEFGSVALYPITLVAARTPRDYDELRKPPVFSYGFYLPQPILVLIITFVYSILPRGRLILVFGWIYFVVGYFTYKYQLLYAMDHPQHSTGQAWSMIFYRVVVGLIIFQLAMAGFLASQQAFVRSLLVVPLIVAGLVSMYRWEENWGRLSRFIALRAVKEPERVRVEETHDERRERGLVFINPSLVSPLEKPWVPGSRDGELEDGGFLPRRQSEDMWAESGDIEDGY